MSLTTPRMLHLKPDQCQVIGPDDFGAPGLWARESVGPFTAVQAFGTLLTVHDSTFEPHRGIGHHPHQRMERLFYILEGTVDHDDTLNGIAGHMGTGDLGILTEGERGMIHSEWNNTDGPARAYIFVYPADPLPATASFDAIRDAEATRVEPTDGVVTKQMVTEKTGRLHGDIRELSDSSLAAGASLDVGVDPDEACLMFAVDGALDVRNGSPNASASMASRHTVLLPPAPQARTLQMEALVPSRMLHAITGRGFGLRMR